MAQSWYRMKGFCLTQGGIAFGAEFDLDFRILFAQTRHTYLNVSRLVMKIVLRAIQARILSVRSECEVEFGVFRLVHWLVKVDAFCCIYGYQPKNRLILVGVASRLISHLSLTHRTANMNDETRLASPK
jgi:hypothetical protein